MKTYFIVVLLLFNSFCFSQNKTSKFEINDIERIYCMPKIAVIQNYLSLLGFKFIENTDGGRNYRYELKNGVATTQILIKILVRDIITSFEIKSSDKTIISSLHDSFSKCGYEKVIPMNNDNDNFNWWQKNLELTNFKMRFVINGYEYKDHSSISYQFFIEKQ